jgi:hypothetical protein
LLENAVQRHWCYVVTGLARHCHESRLGRVLELSMRSMLSHDRPTVVLQHLDDVANLHDAFDTEITVRPRTAFCSCRAINSIVPRRAFKHELGGEFASRRRDERAVAA